MAASGAPRSRHRGGPERRRLSRLYEPDSGLILIDDVPITEYRLADLHANSGIIFQDFVRSEATATDNIGYGRLDAIDDVQRVRKTAAEAGILPYLDTLAEGLDTQLGRWLEGGRQLSGGQWQKVAPARAFLRNAPVVVVLDEPTASIDAAAEAEIFSQLTDIAKDATTLYARLFSLQAAGYLDDVPASSRL